MQAIEWEKIFAIRTSEKAFILQIYKELLMIDGEKNQIP